MTVPDMFQSTFRSVPVASLDLEADKVYIIHQALSAGGLEELRWLFRVYPRATIRDVFVHHPIKTYRPASFFFIKNMLLDGEQVVSDNYVINTPRYTRRETTALI